PQPQRGLTDVAQQPGVSVRGRTLHRRTLAMVQEQGRRRAFRRTIPAQFRFIRRAAGSEGTLIRVNMLVMGFHHPSLRCKPVASWPPGNGRRSTLPKTVDGSPYMNTATSTAYNYKVVRQFARSEEHTSELQLRE